MNDQRSPRVLVVDDEGPVRALLCDLLAVWGCEADAAATGTEGLALFRRGGYDLVVTDFRMPGVTGLELVKTVRQHDPTVGVIIFTASTTDLEGYRQPLGFTLLHKPLELAGLETAVRRALAGKRDGGAPAAGPARSLLGPADQDGR
jgi:CheY-like chemotaxis protein